MLQWIGGTKPSVREVDRVTHYEATKSVEVEDLKPGQGLDGDYVDNIVIKIRYSQLNDDHPTLDSIEIGDKVWDSVKVRNTKSGTEEETDLMAEDFMIEAIAEIDFLQQFPKDERKDCAERIADEVMIWLHDECICEP